MLRIIHNKRIDIYREGDTYKSACTNSWEVFYEETGEHKATLIQYGPKEPATGGTSEFIKTLSEHHLGKQLLAKTNRIARVKTVADRKAKYFPEHNWEIYEGIILQGDVRKDTPPRLIAKLRGDYLQIDNEPFVKYDNLESSDFISKFMEGKL